MAIKPPKGFSIVRRFPKCHIHHHIMKSLEEAAEMSWGNTHLLCSGRGAAFSWILSVILQGCLCSQEAAGGDEHAEERRESSYESSLQEKTSAVWGLSEQHITNHVVATVSGSEGHVFSWCQAVLDVTQCCMLLYKLHTQEISTTWLYIWWHVMCWNYMLAPWKQHNCNTLNASTTKYTSKEVMLISCVLSDQPGPSAVLTFLWNLIRTSSKFSNSPKYSHAYLIILFKMYLSSWVLFHVSHFHKHYPLTDFSQALLCLMGNFADESAILFMLQSGSAIPKHCMNIRLSISTFTLDWYLTVVCQPPV